MRLLAARDLVDFVDEHDAVLFGVLHRAHLEFLFVDHLRGFLIDQQLQRVLDLELAAARAAAPRFWNMPCSCCVISSMPGGAMISTPTGAARTSISISRSSSSLLAQHFAKALPRVVVAGAASP